MILRVELVHSFLYQWDSKFMDLVSGSFDRKGNFLDLNACLILCFLRSEITTCSRYVLCDRNSAVFELGVVCAAASCF